MSQSIINQYHPTEVSPPRETLLDLLEEKGMSQTELAKRMGKTLKAVNELLSDGKDVAFTSETALQLEQVFKLSAGFWMRREQAYRESIARQREIDQLESDVPWLDGIPLAGLRKLGYIKSPRKNVAALREALAFFRVSTVAGWNLFWSKAEVSYRMSESFKGEIGHLAAWLQCGELMAEKINCTEYSAVCFEAALPQIRELTVKSIEEIVTGLTSLCAEAGVAVVFTPDFPKTHVCGAARWIQGGRRPVIQLSENIKSKDDLLFYFRHEAFHILRHAKKSIYVDGPAPSGATIEDEANRWALAGV